MSLIVLELPSPEKSAAASAGNDGEADRMPAELAYAFSPDGSQLGSQGFAAPALLPRAGRVVLVVAAEDLAWHRIAVPKAAAARLRAALGGVLEEHLLADDDAVHLAIWGEATAGQEAWIAAIDKAWLKRRLARLEAVGLHVDAVVPAVAPGAPARGHVQLVGPGGAASAVLADGHGVFCLPLAGAMTRAWVQSRLSGQPLVRGDTAASAVEPQAITWTTSPAAATAAEQWLGHPVPLVGDGERLLAAALSARANLLQFDLAPRQRGTRLLREALASWRAPRWRWLRWGAVGLVLVNLVGLNSLAFQQRRAVAEREMAQVALLKSSFPGVRSVMNAPLQMRAEAERQRAVSGQIGAGDFESLLAALAMAWPEGQAPLTGLSYESGRLTLPAGSLQPGTETALRDRLAAAGVQLQAGEAGAWQLRPASGVLDATP